MAQSIDWFSKRYKSLGGSCPAVTLTQTIRVNTLRITEKELVSRLEKLGVKLEKVPFTDQGYKVVSSPFSLGAISEYLLGYYYLQESASQLAVKALGVSGAKRVLDMCAAPGGKTTQMAADMKGKGVIIALEKKEPRVPSLCNNLERLGVTNCIAYHMDGQDVGSLQLRFDKILLDAECSGNYAAEKNFFKKTSKQSIDENTQLQRSLLSAAWKVLAEDGELVYSTCSLEPEENEMIIDWAVRKLKARVVETGLDVGAPGARDVFGTRLHPDVSKCRRFWPAKHNTQGFFIAKLKK